MSNEVSTQTAQEQFQDRIKDKLRDDIGDLIPDAVMQEMVEKAFEEMFFKPRTEEVDWRAETKTLPSWFEDFVKTQLQSRMEKTMAEYIERNRTRIEQTFIDFYKEQSPLILARAALALISRQGDDAIRRFEQHLNEKWKINDGF